MKQRIGAWCSILSAVLVVGTMVGMQTFTMNGVTGADVYEKTVNSMSLHPVANWLFVLIGLAGIILLYWTFEAVDERIRSAQPNVSRTGIHFANIHLLLYALFLFLPVGILHDLANGDLTTAEALPKAQVILELSLVFSALSSIFFSLFLFQVGWAIIKTNVLSKGFGYFTLLTGIIVLASGAYEALYGRGALPGIFLSIFTFLFGFVVWKIWLGVEMLRKPVAQLEEKSRNLAS
ncbi:hypothetical protein GCM10008967_15180 [Bacillus carboniphilus]|uniref:DUF4386 domain-containing protein n=1 Tax=Bacillus carboniphilus TaxID=86663 RepID=A0ABP3FUN3_9BACI